MTESLKRVSMVLLALAITLGLSGVLTLGTTNIAKADGSNGTIKVKAPSDEEYSNDNQPKIQGCEVVVAWFGFDEGDRNTTVKFESKAPTKNTLVSPSGFQGPYSFTGSGPGDDLDFYKTFTLSFKGDPHPKHGYKVKVTTKTDQNVTKKKTTKTKVFWVNGCKAQEPEKEYFFQFAKVWKGDEVDTSAFDVTLTFDLNGKPVTIDEGEKYPVEKGDVINNFEEGGFTLPEDCTSEPSFSFSQPYTLFNMYENGVNELDLTSTLTTMTEEDMVELMTVTNTVDCEDEPTNPVTPEGGTETPVTPAGPTTPTQVTATPTGAVDAGAGANLVASLAGLMSSAAVVAAGVFLRKFSVVSL